MRVLTVSTDCQHFAWFAVCSKWLKTGLKTAKSRSNTVPLQAYTLYRSLLQILCRHLCRFVVVCRLSQFLAKLDCEQSLSVLRTNRGNTKIERRSGETASESGRLLAIFPAGLASEQSLAHSLAASPLDFPALLKSVAPK